MLHFLLYIVQQPTFHSAETDLDEAEAVQTIDDDLHADAQLERVGTVGVRFELPRKGAYFEGAFARFLEHVPHRPTGVDVVLTTRNRL